MSASEEKYQRPKPGHYRLRGGIRLLSNEKPASGVAGTVGGVAIVNYPLHIVRLNATNARLLALCAEERTCEELARATGLPLTRVTALCEQLRWKGLLEAGLALPPATWPLVSIIIPTYNRAKQLERCLRSLLGIDYPAQHLEIIVVDDASTDETPGVALSMSQKAEARGWSLQVVRHEQRQGVGKGRNTGAGAARHELLVYIDDDCIASPGWLRELVPAFQDARVAAVGGVIRSYRRDTLLGRYEDVRSSLFMGLQPQLISLQGPLTYLPTANLLIRRAAWQQLGGFVAMPQGEDVDFCRRLLLAGYSIHYLPQGIVYHDYRTTLGAFLRTRVAYASSEAPLLQRYPAERRVLLLPPEQATFAGALIGASWSLIQPTAWSAKKGKGAALPALLFVLLALIIVLTGTRRRLQKVQAQHITLHPLQVLKATLRGYLAYTYHLCRHLTRYYTLPLLLAGLLFPPLLPGPFILAAIVIGVDYVRLQPAMNPGEFALCSLLDDCAYEVGVVWGCLTCKMWQPLLPVIKRRV